MPFTSFLADPKAYLNTHHVLLANSDDGAGTITVGAAAAAVGGHHGIRMTWNGTTHGLTRTQPVGGGGVGVAAALPGKMDLFKAKVGLSPKITRNYWVESLGAAADNGFRYLPFRQNHVTYMQMDAAATFCLTGPLTGCTVAAGRTGAGSVWFYHSNDNTNHGNAARAIQRNLLVWAGGVPTGVGILNMQLCEMTHHYTDMAFVFGRRRGGGRWKFYVHNVGLAGGAFNSRTTKWAEV